MLAWGVVEAETLEAGVNRSIQLQAESRAKPRHPAVNTPPPFLTSRRGRMNHQGTAP